MNEDTFIFNNTEIKQFSFSVSDKNELFVSPAGILMLSVYLCIALVAVVGNGLVLFVSLTNRNQGELKHLDCVIRSLAVTDLLFGLIGIPCRIIAAKMAYRGLYIIFLDLVL